MPCDTIFRRKQTIQQRVAEVQKVVDIVGKGLLNGRIKLKVGPQGAPAFTGLTTTERDDVTDVCIYRRLQSSPTVPAIVRMKLAELEAAGGRAVNKQALAQGAHSHDGGTTWHDHKG